MTKELDALLTELYVLVDDHVVAPRTGRGRVPVFSDSELITLAVAQVLLGSTTNDAGSGTCTPSRPGVRCSPTCPSSPGCTAGSNARPLLCAAIRVLAQQCPSWFDDLWMTDATPVPCGVSRETVKRSALAGHAGYGYCASHSRFFWGLKLYLVCAGDGMPIMWCLANPKLGERDVVAALLDPRRSPAAQRADPARRQGLRRRASSKQVTDAMGLRLLRPDRRDETYTHGNLGGVRQWIESVNQTLKGQLDLERHGARTHEGVFTRIAARLLALATGIWHNWTTGTTSKRSLIAFDH